MTIEDALRRYPLTEPTRIFVEAAARSVLQDDPERDPTAIVQEIVLQNTVPCFGCGMFMAPALHVITRCDVCKVTICVSCMRGFGRQGKDGDVRIVVMCPRCWLTLERDHEAIAYFRAVVLERERRDGNARPGGQPT